MRLLAAAQDVVDGCQQRARRGPTRLGVLNELTDLTLLITAETELREQARRILRTRRTAPMMMMVTVVGLQLLQIALERLLLCWSQNLTDLAINLTLGLTLTLRSRENLPDLRLLC